MKSKNGHSQLMDRVSKTVSGAPGKFILVKYYNKNERIDYCLPHILDILSNGLEYLKRYEKKKSSNGKTMHFGKYRVECAIKFAELIKAVNESHNDGATLFVYRESGILPKNVYIEPEDLDVFKFVPSGNTAKRYKIKYNKSKTGVILEYDHDVPYYKLQSVTTGEYLDVPEITIDDVVSMGNVILKNVFNFIKYDYYFAEEDVDKVQEIIKTFKLRVCQKCGTSFYIDPKQFNFIRTHSMNLPILCQICAKTNRDKISRTVDVEELLPETKESVTTEEKLVVEEQSSETKANVITEEKPVVTELDKVSEEKPDVAELDKVYEEKPIVTELDKVSEEKPVVTELDKVSEEKPVIVKEQVSEEKPIVTELDKVSEESSSGTPAE